MRTLEHLRIKTKSSIRTTWNTKRRHRSTMYNFKNQ